jgi:hypothetical protein
VAPEVYRAVASHVERCGCRPELVSHLETAANTTEIVERMDSGDMLGTGELGVDAAAMWKLATEKLYQNSDLIALATREAMQNSVDAVRAAYRARQIERGAGFFSVTWEPQGSTGTLTFADNGTGMDDDTLRRKFLTLGGTGKGTDTSGETVGGFGMAKAVILGVSPTGRWEVHTRDLGVAPVPGSLRYNIYRMPPRQGTKIVLHDIPTEKLWSTLFHNSLAPGDRIRYVIGLSDVDDMSLLFNGNAVEPAFPRRKGHYLDRFGSTQADWGEGNTVTVKNYRRDKSSGEGQFYVRLGGLFQFAYNPHESGGHLPSDVVIDIRTSNRPQDRQYPLNASRDAWNGRGSAIATFREVARELIKEYHSAKQPKTWETLTLSSEEASERAGGEEFGNALRDVFSDPSFAAIMQEVAGGIQDFLRETSDKGKTPVYGDESNAAGNQAAADPYDSWREVPTAPETTDEIKLLGQIAREVVTRVNAEGGAISPSDVRAIESLEEGVLPSAFAVDDLLTAIEEGRARADTSSHGNAPSFAGRAVESKVLSALAPLAPAYRQKRTANPFGTAGIVKINLTTYERAEIRRFMNTARDFIPYLALWDVTLRLVANEAGIKEKFRVGFVLDHDVRGLATSDGDPGTSSYQVFVLIEPYKLREVIRAHKNRPWAVASYLHQIAAHELAHLPNMGAGHSERWAIERENLGAQTAHVLPAIERAVTAALGLKAPESKQAQAAAAELRRQIREEERARAEKTAATRAERSWTRKLDQALRAETERCAATVMSLKLSVSDLVARLQGLLEYQALRAYVAKAGPAFLPRGTTTEAVLEALDAHPMVVAKVLLGEGQDRADAPDYPTLRARTARKAALSPR